MGPIKVMKYNPVCDSVLSADAKGIIEYWSPATLKFPEDEYVLTAYFCIIIVPASMHYV